MTSSGFTRFERLWTNLRYFDLDLSKKRFLKNWGLRAYEEKAGCPYITIQINDRIRGGWTGAQDGWQGI